MAMQKTSVYLACDSNTWSVGGSGRWCNFMIFPRRSFNSQFQPARDSCGGKWSVRTFVTLLNRAVLQLINVHLTSVLFPPEIRWDFFLFFFFFCCRVAYIYLRYMHGRILKRLKFSFNQSSVYINVSVG